MGGGQTPPVGERPRANSAVSRNNAEKRGSSFPMAAHASSRRGLRPSADEFAGPRNISIPLSQTAASGQLRDVSSLEHAVSMPASVPSGDGFGAGSEPARTAALVARRSAFTGRVTYVDPQGARALRRRVPRPILASASLMAVAVGMAFGTMGTPGSSGTPASPSTIQEPSALTIAPLDASSTR